LTTKRALLGDQNGTPLSFTLARGPVHELKLAASVLEQVSISGCRGKPKKRLGKLLADRLYASRSFRQIGRCSNGEGLFPVFFRKPSMAPERACSAAVALVVTTGATSQNVRSPG